MSEFDQWFPSASKQIFGDNGPRFRLVCFPSSGTMESLFTGKVRLDRKMHESVLMKWAADNHVEILSVQLPGRGLHAKTPFLKSLSEVGTSLAPILKPRLSQQTATGEVVPWAVMGHSMGCWAAYETIHELELMGVPPPRALIVACFCVPDIEERPWTRNADLDDTAFKVECSGWDIRDQVLETPHIWNSFKAMLRADFTLFDTYECGTVRKVNCDVYGCASTLDKRITSELVNDWKKMVAPGFSFHQMQAAEGTHLFLLDDVLKEQWFKQSLLPVLQTQFDLTLRPPLPPPRPPLAGAAEEPTQSKAMLRILCLHGFGCCDEILEIQTKRLREVAAQQLDKPVEYIFVSAPDKAMWDPESYEARLVTTFFKEKANRQWMRRVSSDGTTAKVQTSEDGTLIADNVTYTDWAGPLTFLLGYIQKHGPFDGLLGFSQGANLAVLLTALLEAGAYNQDGSEEASMRFGFVVAICGSAFGWEKQWKTATEVLPRLPPSPLFASPLQTKSLHFIGTADPYRAASDKLVTLFQGPKVYSFPSGHKPPTQKAAAVVLAEFLTAQF